MNTGDLLMLSTEEYSDQTHSGPYRVLQDFDISAVAELVSKLPSTSAWRGKSGPDDVIAYLETNKYIELVVCKCVHLGSYGDIDPRGDLK